MLFLRPQVAWHALRPGDLFWAPQPLSDWNSKMQVCSGLRCVWPLAGEDTHTSVPESVHWPFGDGLYASDGTHRRRWSDVPRDHLGMPPVWMTRCGAGLPVRALALSFVLEVLYWGRSEKALTPPIEIEVCLYSGVDRAFREDQKSEQSQGKLHIQDLPPDLCPLGRVKIVF